MRFMARTSSVLKSWLESISRYFLWVFSVPYPGCGSRASRGADLCNERCGGDRCARMGAMLFLQPVLYHKSNDRRGQWLGLQGLLLGGGAVILEEGLCPWVAAGESLVL